jgi:foldase protein PrsA
LTFQKGEMVKEFEDWSFKANIGDIGLVKTDFGYHITKLEKKSSFDEIKDTVKKDLIVKTYTDRLADWKQEPGNKLVINSKVFDSLEVNITPSESGN